MARNRKTFWTSERLAELVKVYPTLTRSQLTKKYGKTIEAITIAYDYARASKRMKISSKKTKHGGRIIVYKTGYAENYRPISIGI